MLAVIKYSQLLLTADTINDEVNALFAQHGELQPNMVPFFGAQLRLVPVVMESIVETVYHCASDDITSRIEHDKVIQTPTLTLKPMEQVRAAKLEELAHYRWQMETGGVEFNGVTIKTDEQSQAKVQGALTFLTRNPSDTINWKGKDGWIELNKTAIEAISDQVASHVQSCYATEKTIANAISELTTSTQTFKYDIPKAWQTIRDA